MSFFHELWSWIFCEVKWFIFKMIKYCKVYIENQIFDMISLKKVRWFDITKILRKDLIYYFLICAWKFIRHHTNIFYLDLHMKNMLQQGKKKDHFSLLKFWVKAITNVLYKTIQYIYKWHNQSVKLQC